MGFNGYLIQIGIHNVALEEYIEYKTYKVSRKVQDLDSYRDANGILHRNVLDHESYVIEFKLRPLNNLQYERFMSMIRENYISSKERRLSLTFFLPELNDYITTDVYMPDPETPIKRIEGPLVFYDGITVKFIGY